MMRKLFNFSSTFSIADFSVTDNIIDKSEITDQTKETFENKRQAAIDYLGEKWLLHPANAIKKPEIPLNCCGRIINPKTSEVTEGRTFECGETVARNSEEMMYI